MRVLGVDIATHTGLAIVDDEGGKGKQVVFPDQKGFERLQSIASEVRRTLQIWQPDLAIIEGYAFANQNTLVTLVECGTVIRYVLHELKVPWWTMTPSSLKKWTTGSGAASKDLMAAKVFERWGFRSHSDDIVDAYALAQVGRLEFYKLNELKGLNREH